MSKAQAKKHSVRVDMTAMCDVAFLLLTFFVMTSTARVPEPHPVDTPSSTIQQKMPESNIATITVGDGKIFFGVAAGQEVRKLMLEKMAGRYNMAFTPEQIEEFSLIDNFGVTMRQLPALIALKSAERNTPGLQQGIPIDSLDNQLYDWLIAARTSVKQINNDDLNIAIKGDSNVEFPLIKRVIDILQSQRKNNFFLVTNLRDENY